MDKLLDYKRTYVASDGDTYINLSIPALDNEKIKISSVARLSSDDNGRIDNFVYNNIQNIDAVDLFMYANHIFNPFAVQENDVVYVPNNDDIYSKQEEPSLIDGTKLSDKLNNTETKTYAETVEYLGKLGLGIK